MLGAIIGAGVGALGSLFGGMAQRREARKRAEFIDRSKAKNDAWYNRRYNEDTTQRADAQAALTRMREAMAERTRNAAGTAAVMGTSEAGVAAEKEAQNNALADTVSNINAQGEARKDAIDEQHREKDDQLDAQKMGLSAEKQAQTAQALGGVLNAAGGIADAIDTREDMKDLLKTGTNWRTI